MRLATSREGNHLDSRMIGGAEEVSSVYVEEDVEFTTGEEHSYFPEWADRPALTGGASVSDHNSYIVAEMRTIAIPEFE